MADSNCSHCGGTGYCADEYGDNSGTQGPTSNGQMVPCHYCNSDDTNNEYRSHASSNGSPSTDDFVGCMFVVAIIFIAIVVLVSLFQEKGI